MSPQRSLQSQLEDRSRIEFARALPREWVCRDVPKDYGIDVEVEVFAAGSATGITLKVQLKATATRSGSHASQKIKLDHLAYWSSLDSPVLLVLYVEDEGAIFARWAVSHDPGPNLKTTSKWTTIKFTEDDRLAVRLPSLSAEALTLRDIRGRRIPIPVPVRLISNFGAVQNYKLVRSMRSIIAEKGLRDVVRVVTDRQQPALTATVSKTVLRLAMPLDAGSISLHAIGPEYNPSDDADEVAQTILVMIGAQCNRFDRHSEALEILRACVRSAALRSYEISAEFSQAMMVAGKPDVGVRAAAKMLESDPYLLFSFNAIQTLGSAAVLFADQLEDVESALDLFRRLSEGARFREQYADAGAMLFNCANILRKRGRYAESVSEFEKAIVLKTVYATSPEYYELYGMAAFGNRDFVKAASAYSRAAELGEMSDELHSHLADARMWAGEYREASDVIAGKGRSALTDHLSVVNRVAVAEILAETGLEKQVRRDLIQEEIDAAEKDPAVARNLLIVADALVAGLWQATQPDWTEWSLERTILIARLIMHSGHTWALATFHAYSSEEHREELFPVVVEMALNEAADEYLDFLEQTLDQAGTPDDLRPILEYAHDAALTLRERPASITVLGPDGRFILRTGGQDTDPTVEA